MEAKAERRCARCKQFSRAMLKNGEGHHSDDAVKKGCELRCKKIALCIAAFRVAALWCTKLPTRQRTTWFKHIAMETVHGFLTVREPPPSP